MRAYHDSDDEKMTEIRARVDEIVDDPTPPNALKPWYRQLCKRPCFHDEYLQAFNNPNVHLVDTDGQGVDRIDATGIWAGGDHYELDCIIYASGFEVGTDYARRSGYDTVGRDGLRLSEKWADGMQTLHGMHVHGFPNLFVVSPTQAANLISNVPHNLVEAGETIAAIIAPRCRRRRRRGRGHRRGGGGVGRSTRERRAPIRQQSRLHPRLLQQRGPGARPARTAERSATPRARLRSSSYIDEWRTSGEFEGLEFRLRA